MLNPPEEFNLNELNLMEAIINFHYTKLVRKLEKAGHIRTAKESQRLVETQMLYQKVARIRNACRSQTSTNSRQ